MNYNTIFPFTFHGDKLYIVEHKGEPYVAMKHVVEGMGLSRGSQHIRLKDRFSGGSRKSRSPWMLCRKKWFACRSENSRAGLSLPGLPGD
ncbi:phage antirepressor N-terminal domain-containing protein [Mixta mediterraneensis]|uniref:phage antirepressor N-terminal domain-containing protein n=1 Tax=Mixta mediterraneensis TaxID=2758443 RepID=UPI003AFFCA08